MSEEVTISTFGGIIAFILYWAFPITSALAWYKMSNSEIKYFLIGILGFIGSAVAESIILFLILANIISNQNTLKIISCFTSGLFEEGARFICFIYILRKCKKKYVSISYGIGHGGIEMMLYSIIILFYICNKESVIKGGTVTSSIGFLGFIIRTFVRVLFMIFNIAASFLVFKSVKEKNYLYFIILIIIHDAMEASPLFTENNLIIFLISIIICGATTLVAYNLYRRMNEEESEEGLSSNIAPQEETIGNANVL